MSKIERVAGALHEANAALSPLRLQEKARRRGTGGEAGQRAHIRSTDVGHAAIIPFEAEWNTYFRQNCSAE